MLEKLEVAIVALSGPAGAMLLLAAVLVGVWKLLDKGLNIFSSHLERIEAAFDRLTNTVESAVSRLDKGQQTVEDGVEQVQHKLELVLDRQTRKELNR